jgi:hypothetical protein
MPQNSLYNTLRSWVLHKYPPDRVMTAQDVVRIVDDLVTLMELTQAVQNGVLLPDTKGQIITSDGTTPVLQDVGSDGRIIIADSAEPNGWNWFDPSVLGFMSALLVRLNGTDIGSQIALNFLDGGGITWTVTNDAGNTEVEISGAVAFPTKYVAIPVSASSFAAPAQNATYYFGGNPSRAPQTAITREQQLCPVTGTITAVYLQGTWGNTPTGNNHTFNVRVNNTTDALITNTQPISGASPVLITNASMSQAVTAGNLLAIKWATPATWTTPVTNIIWNGFIVISY